MADRPRLLILSCDMTEQLPERTPSFTDKAVQQAGWLGALRDSVVGPALSRLHEEPTRAWTLADLRIRGRIQSRVQARNRILSGGAATRARVELSHVRARDGRQS